MASEFTFDEVMDQLRDTVRSSGETLVKHVEDEIQSAFPAEEVETISSNERGARVRVASEDKDFLQKEFGSDQHHPAHRAMKLKRGISRNIKKWVR